MAGGSKCNGVVLKLPLICYSKVMFTLVTDTDRWLIMQNLSGNDSEGKGERTSKLKIVISFPF